MYALFSEIDSDRLAISAGTPIIITEKKSIINEIINVIIKYDQKFMTAALKNSCDENLPLLFFIVPNKPAVMKVFIKYPTRKIIIKPAVKNETRLFTTGPRSAKTSISNPSASFSVIILLPNTEFNEPLNGKIKTMIIIKKENQNIRTPFLTFKALLRPDFSEYKIVISRLIRDK
jgi:hypothetical protein